MDRADLPKRWWERSAGVLDFFGLKPRGRTLRDLLARLDTVQEWGYDAISIGVPYQGGIQYAGLDVIDFYAVDPAIGDFHDLEALIGECHARGMAVIGAFNLG